MSQNDFTLANQSFPAFRADLNSALQALASNSSGGSAPSTTFANMWWYDTSNNIMYIRNEDNDAWIKFAELDQANDKFVLSGTLQLDDGTVSAPALTFNSDTNMGIYRGGTDILKFVTAGTDAITINASQNVTFHGNISGGLTSTGDLDVSASNARIRMFETDTTDLNTQLQTNGGEFLIKTLLDDASNSTSRITIDHSTGDISFYEDTGSTPKMVWKASDESLGIGTSSPNAKTEITTSSGENLRLTKTTGAYIGFHDGTVSRGAISGISGADGLQFTSGASGIDVTIDANGNVGIGDTSPDAKLDVHGNVEFGDGGGFDMNINGTRHQFSIGGTECMRISSGGDISFYEDTGTTPKMVWSASGERLKIGDSSAFAPGGLVVGSDTGGVITVTKNGGTYAQDDLIGSLNWYTEDASLDGPNVTARIAAFANGVSGDDAYLTFSTKAQPLGADAAESMRIRADGNVGIGTASGNGNLTVASTGDAELDILADSDNNGSNNWPILNFRINSPTGTPSARIYKKESDDALIFDNAGIERMRIDANGHVTMPYQSAFLAKPTSNISNLTINVNTTVPFGTEIFDQNNDFASDTFTAPVTGKYQLSLQIRFNQLDVDGTFYEVKISTSNREYINIIDMRPFDADAPNYTSNFTILADMDASDTAYVRVKPYNSGASQADIEEANTYFSGFLAC